MKIGRKFLLTLLVIIISVGAYASGTKVIKHPTPEENLNTKWQWALQQSQNNKNGIWIGYSIIRKMHKKSSIGIHISTDEKYYSPTLEQIIYSRNNEQFENENLTDVAKKALANLDNSNKSSDEIVEKEIVFLFYFNSDPIKNKEPEIIFMSNLYFYFDFENKPVIWLGPSSQDESAKFLINKYNEISDAEIRKHFIAAIGVHNQSKIPIDFLTAIIKSDEENKIRSKAIFWLSEHGSESSVNFLMDIAKTDRSKDFREKAVFALYQMESKKAENTLIDLANNSKDRKIKKKSIFWLGQKAANKSAEILEEIVENDEDTEMKEQAVFALSQLEDNEGIPSLIEIANTHSNNEVRKKAIFWLGESEDPRALEAIINLIEKNR